MVTEICVNISSSNGLLQMRAISILHMDLKGTNLRLQLHLRELKRTPFEPRASLTYSHDGNRKKAFSIYGLRGVETEAITIITMGLKSVRGGGEQPLCSLS